MTIRRHRPLATLALALVLLAIPGIEQAWAAPEPDPVPTRWEFQADVGPLRVAIVRTPNGFERYFYLTYTVTNSWGTDLLFFPDLQLKTDEATVQRSGRDVPSGVRDEIMRRLDDPLIEDQIAIVGQVLQGPEHARTGVAIWPALDLEVDEVAVFFAGLSGENKSYVVVDDRTGERVRFNLRKTLMLRYATPGEFGSRDNEELELIERRWVMR